MNEFYAQFVEAVKHGLTFATSRGQRTISEMWTLPLTGNNGYNLDVISRELLSELRKTQEESLVVETTKANRELQVKLEILKFIIDDKKAEKAAKRLEIEKAEKRRELQEAIVETKKKMYKEKTLEELQAELAALS
ncbi:hypothetical protein VmeM32_00189 [Vibrio phage vB_VmeM-32]|nr:hypothetical protein VmeM32_00189 [Vibrio phage vB_VmeM-32]